MSAQMRQLQLELFNQKITRLEFCRLPGDLRITLSQELAKLGIVLERIREAAVIVGVGKLRVQLNGLAGVLNGTVVLACLAVRDAAVIVGRGILRVQLNGLDGGWSTLRELCGNE